MVSFLEELERVRAKTLTRSADPWRIRLERLRGTVGDDAIERVTTQAVFDTLEVPQGKRGAGASRRLAAVMRGLGWSPVRVRGLTRGGYLEQVRGYCRDVREAKSGIKY